MDKDYLTIKEYADLQGVSYHAIYKKLNTTLLPYVKEVKGHKVLKIEVLEDFVNPQNFTVKENLFNGKEKNFNPSASSIEDELKRIIARNEELIDDLRAQIKEKDIQLQQTNDKVVALFETNQRLMENNQKLQLNYQFLLSDGKLQNDDAEVEIQDARVEETEEKPKKKGFLSWLFGED